jgi:hypothetical protein
MLQPPWEAGRSNEALPASPLGAIPLPPLELPVAPTLPPLPPLLVAPAPPPLPLPLLAVPSEPPPLEDPLPLDPPPLDPLPLDPLPLDPLVPPELPPPPPLLPPLPPLLLLLPPLLLPPSCATVPLKTSRSTMLEIPATVPVELVCQNAYVDHGAGTSGQLTPQLATQSP